MNPESIPFYQKVLKDNPFKNRILFLLENQPEIREDYWNIDEGSSCFGTTVFLHRMQDAAKQSWVELGNRLEDRSCAMGNYIVDRSKLPQHIGEEPYLAFLAQHAIEIQEPELNSIVTYSWESETSERIGFAMRHAGICLDPKITKEPLIFHQTGFGLEFEINHLDHLRHELSEKNLKTLKTQFWRIKRRN